MISIPFNADFSEQMDRTNSHGDYPCIVCGRKCTNPRFMVYVDSAFQHILTGEEFQQDAGDMGMYPIGPDCLKKHPEIKSYVQAQPSSKNAPWKLLYFDLYRQVYGEQTSERDVMIDVLHRMQTLRDNGLL